MLRLQMKRVEKQQQMIDVREAFNLWDILKSKYYILENLETYEEFVHDLDLKMFLANYIKTFRKNAHILEDLMRRYAVMGPEQHRGASHWAGNPEAVRDEFAASTILLYMQEHIANLLRASRTSVTNDYCRSVIVKMLKQTIRKTDTLYKYMKMKGWIENPPLYLNSPGGTSERISCVTAAYLWDHLTLRYDNLRQTKIFCTLINDGDFKLFMERGIKVLNHQIGILEQECIQFGITLPKKPSEVIVAPPGVEIMQDDQIYRMLLNGFQGAGQMHAEAIRQVIFNDRIRRIFLGMFIEEIAFYEYFVRYGKVKGWLHPTPAYRV